MENFKDYGTLYTEKRVRSFGYTIDVFSDDELICEANYNTDGKLIHVYWYKDYAIIELSRAQGYKYWRKYFRDRPVYHLPMELQEAIKREPVAFGYFTRKDHTVCGYEG
jgi:hypothetical protein